MALANLVGVERAAPCANASAYQRAFFSADDGADPRAAVLATVISRPYKAQT